jgi:hypothetical protein
MSAQYKVAIRENEAWNFLRNLEFAQSVLLPKTKRIIASDLPPNLASLDKLPWIHTNDPGIYFCKALKFDSEGKIVSRMDKIGCAWSRHGGLDHRRSIQEK